MRGRKEKRDEGEVRDGRCQGKNKQEISFNEAIATTMETFLWTFQQPADMKQSDLTITAMLQSEK